MPNDGQREAKCWHPVELDDGWYGVPSFRFIGLLAVDRLPSDYGIEYAAPSMMALASLLSHPQLGNQRIESGMMQGILRSAKDLGRVLTLAYLAGREETESWIDGWLTALHQTFPLSFRELGATLDTGIREMLENDNAMRDAHRTTEIGLLSGMNVTVENLAVTGERLLEDVIQPVQQRLESA